MITKSLAVLSVAVVVAWSVTKLLIPFFKKRGLVDVPNSRSSHYTPTPTGGGIGIVAALGSAFLVAGLIGLPTPAIELLLAVLVIALVGFLDDRTGGLSVLARFSLHVCAAVLVVSQTGGIDQLPFPEPLNISTGRFAVPLAVIWIVGVTNVYNFLDGIDGFAGLQGTLAGFGVALIGDNGPLLTIGLAITGGCLGFLIHNWHPAKVFMGDVGSGILGFLLAAAPLQVAHASRTNAVFLVSMCLWFFLSDGVFTILRRLSRGERIWQAHRSHLYQRLVQSGLSHDSVTLKVLGLGALLSAMATYAIRSDSIKFRWIVLATAFGSFIAYWIWTALRERDVHKKNRPMTELNELVQTDRIP